MTREDFVINICEIFEDFLYDRNIMIDNPERIGDPDEAAIFGSDWEELTGAVDKFISDEIDYFKKSKDLEYPELENTYF